MFMSKSLYVVYSQIQFPFPRLINPLIPVIPLIPPVPV